VQPSKVHFTVVNEQFLGKLNEVSGHDGTNTKYAVKTIVIIKALRLRFFTV
jgi:hypothetical protein